MDKKRATIAKCMTLGAGTGLVVGVIFGAVGIFLALGTGIGVAMGSAVAQRAQQEQEGANSGNGTTPTVVEVDGSPVV